jgi:hypothetical protein
VTTAVRRVFAAGVSLAIYLYNMPVRRRARRVVREADAVLAEMERRYARKATQ